MTGEIKIFVTLTLKKKWVMKNIWLPYQKVQLHIKTVGCIS